MAVDSGQFAAPEGGAGGADIAPEAPPQPSGFGGFISRRVFGLPVWSWVIILGVGGIIAYFVIRSNTQANAQDVSNTAQAGGLGIDPATGLPYATNGTGGINPGGAFAGETTYDPFANTNALLQQLLNQQQQNTNPPTSPGGNTSPLALPGYDPNTRIYTLPVGMTLAQVAALFGVTAAAFYYNTASPLDRALHDTLQKYGGYKGTETHIFPKGTQVYIAGLNGTNPGAIDTNLLHGQNPVDPIVTGPLGTKAA
jgi:hypothetical protein